MNRVLFFIILFSANTIFSQSTLDSLLMEGINRHRDSLGLPKLSYDMSSSDIAHNHACYTFRLNSNDNRVAITHNRLDSNSVDFRARNEFFQSRGNISEVCGFHNLNIKLDIDYMDNIIKIANSILDSYMNSPDHYQKIVNPNYTLIGIGSATKNRPTNVRDWCNLNIFSTIILS
jgi:uncharacterized protein YkwD